MLKRADDVKSVEEDETGVVENNAVLGNPVAGKTDDMKVDNVGTKVTEDFEQAQQEKPDRLEGSVILKGDSQSAGDSNLFHMLQEHRRSMNAEASGLKPFSGVRGVEMACTTPAKKAGDHTGDVMEMSPFSGVETHKGVLRRVAGLAERGRAHAALQLLHTVDGKKKGSRVAVPYRVYALLFRALSNGYSVKGREEVELAAAPESALLWLLRGMARQGHEPKRPLLNFGLEAFAVAAKSGKVGERGGCSDFSRPASSRPLPLILVPDEIGLMFLVLNGMRWIGLEYL